MIEFKIQEIFQLINKAIYLLSLIIGFYFIYQGEVIKRFQQKRTNFAEYDEPVDELPTISTYIHSSDTKLKFGTDFNISYGPYMTSKASSLTEGENVVTDSTLKLFFEDIGRNTFKITPLNFEPGMPLDYELTFDFKNDSFTETTVVGFRLVTESNSVPVDGKFVDGDTNDLLTHVGLHQSLTLFPEKYIFSQEHHECRERPFYEILLQKISQYIGQRCKVPFRPNESYGRTWNKIVEHLPYCQSMAEEKCYHEVQALSQEEVEQQPCTKLQYRWQKNMFHIRPKNRLIISMVFLSPPRVTVKEEYLIYDTVAMIRYGH